jgi:hypothetical protein
MDRNRKGRDMKIKVSALLGTLLVFLLIGLAYARSSYMTSFNSRYGTSATVLNTCNLCHPGGDTGSYNPYGTDFLDAGSNTAAFAAIENLDSDGDGFTNIVEINARTFPGDPSSFPAGDATLPVVTGFSIPATATTLTVPISVFTATDNVAVTGYLVNEVSTKPASGAAGWAATPPASYLFATEGVKTLYGWAKDAAGNVSNGASGSVTITLPDATLPVVTGFSIPATATTLTVPISVFTATDNVAVTGFLVNESSTKPAAGAAEWAATPPANYLFATEGVKTLYGWAKDAAGNVSNGASGSVTITLPDATLPVVTGFSIPATATALTVPISVFTATDNVAVTGYLVNESSTKPASGAAGWAATPPANYVFATEGSKTLYGWAKDAAGNVSNALSATVAISLINNNPGTIQGSVSVNFAGHSNLGVANATVSLRGTNFATTTDADGKFMLTSIPPGSYQIVVASPDVAATAQQIRVDAGANLQINILAVARQKGDANGDNKLGLEDAVYILQILTNTR